MASSSSSNTAANKLDPTLYATNASFVYSQSYTTPILDLLAAKPGEKILDLGCGNGALTDRLSNIVGEKGEVWGTDYGDDMIKQASESFPHLAPRLFQSDAQDLQLPSSHLSSLENSFDAVFSNATLHWCKRSPIDVLKGVKKVLKKNGQGRFVAEMGGFLNCVGVRSAVYQVMRERGHTPEEKDPWWFPTDEEYRRLLESAGFQVVHISLTPRIVPLETGLYGWMSTFVRPYFLAGLSDQEADSILKEVVERCRIDCCSIDKTWRMMYVRLRFVAVLKE